MAHPHAREPGTPAGTYPDSRTGSETAGLRWPWLRLVTATLARCILLTAALMVLWAALPTAWGWHSTTVVTDSMRPRIAAGDVVVARPVPSSSLRPGQVLLVDDPDRPDSLRLHRFLRPDPTGRLVLKGDANPGPDSTPVAVEAVHGVGYARVPFVGLPVAWARNGSWVKLALLLALIGALAVVARLDRGLAPRRPGPGAPRGAPPGSTSDSSADAGPGPPSPPETVERRAASRRRRGSCASVVLIALCVAAPAAATPSAARYSARTNTPVNTWGAAPFYTCRAAVLASSPFLYYRLDETSGSTVTDSSGNGRHGALQGNRINAGSGGCLRDGGTAIALDGNTNYISTPTRQESPNTFTIQAWFRTTTTRGGHLVGFGSQQTGASPNHGRTLYLTNGGQLVFGVNNGARRTLSSPTRYNDGRWHRATATLSSAGMRLYVDGQLLGSDPATTTGFPMSGYWRMGFGNLSDWPSAPTSNFLAGTIDGVAVYPTALSAATIAAQYGAGT